MASTNGEIGPSDDPTAVHSNAPINDRREREQDTGDETK